MFENNYLKKFLLKYSKYQYFIVLLFNVTQIQGFLQIKTCFCLPRFTI